MTASAPDQFPQVESILVIDDDDNWCFVTKRLLIRANACNTILTAQNGLEALRKLEELTAQGENMPDIIFLDIKMPVMDGFGFLSALESNAHLDLSQTKIYICSSSLHPKDKETAARYKVAGFINKPLTKDTLQHILQQNAASDKE
ncbi:response regulator [Pontibacter akesuensis]|uniref:Response regulator receiver domain-containing protein n=1 Tax=Pontibacter akesuensis TaxID=388950 RepID=A0A1I7KSE8_9BACT|nr:response regulator [Pontibacter akesuensis]GHA80922.1 response regulator [Pontibacter akesuensis]SFV00402.1 Response regulator receiver domain-containing protein [Pontibacter akesuensis]